MRPNIVFLGTPEAAVPTLVALVEKANVVAVVTQPDRAQGRSKEPVAPPVKTAAVAAGLRVVQPGTREQLNAALLAMEPTDLGVVVAYGMILDDVALAVPRRGMINVHFSLLPRWRGAAPVERAILEGDTETGVTIMQMDRGLDTGDIVASAVVAIDDSTAGELTGVLSNLGTSLMMGVLDAVIQGRAPRLPQAEDGVRYASKLTTVEAEIDFSLSTESVLRHIRAYNPRPGAYAYRDGERFKVWEARAAVADPEIPPGVLIADEGALTVSTRDGAIAVNELQPPGKPRMTSAAWLLGQQIPLGRFSKREDQ